jgi:hypothetical protein
MEQPYVKDKNFNIHLPVEYAPDGQMCRYYIFKEDLPNIAAGYMSIIHDLTECEVALKTLQPIINDDSVATIIKSSLYTSTVSLYIRCFNQRWGRMAGLDNSIYNDLNPELNKFHEEVNDMRNEFIGHAGKSKHETISLILYFHPVTEQIVTSKGAITKHQFGHGIELFLELVNLARKAADDKFKKLKPDLEQFILSQDRHKLFKRAKMPKVQDFI